MKRLEMVRLPLPMVIVGILVALMAKAMLVRPPSGILALTEVMSIELLVLEKKGDRLLGLLASQIPQESPAPRLFEFTEVWTLPL